MARSKFPGKPSKPVNRTRVNVLYSTEADAVTNLNSAEVKQGDFDSGIDTLEVLTASAKKPRKKRVCKTLIGTKRSSQKLISVVDSVHSGRKKTDKRSENEGLNRKLIKTKQSRLESNNLVGKFILPSRSVHSSRVIKPNKRFINVEAVNSVPLRTFKKRVNKKVDTNNSSVSLKSDCKKENDSSTGSHTPFSSRRIILRQARLQLHTLTPLGPEGPFSSNYNSNLSPPGTVTCGVCGAVRFYRFVKQARKFNIHSCESCRKFISKMIKCQISNKKLPPTECLKGQGTCHVPPIVRSQHWKFRCAYKARCNACWLKMCLRSFQIPPILKKNLINLLPEYMRESDPLFNTSLFSFHTINNSVSASPQRSNISDIEQLRRRPLRKKVNSTEQRTIKRQKIEVKGPRVKHVCRSASIVLGQPLAVFPEGDKKPIESNIKLHEDVDNIEDNIESKNIENCNLGISKLDVPKREKSNNKVPIHGSDVKVKRAIEIDNNICIDFWENYDPEEVGQNGFGLIASLSFPMLAVCYLCGSAGQDSLLYCCLCCEAYHAFCLEQPPQNIDVTNNCYNWSCPRCTMCSTCGEADKQKINCQKCHRAYHPECFNTKWRTDDTQTVQKQTLSLFKVIYQPCGVTDHCYKKKLNR